MNKQPKNVRKKQVVLVTKRRSAVTVSNVFDGKHKLSHYIKTSVYRFIKLYHFVLVTNIVNWNISLIYLLISLTFTLSVLFILWRIFFLLITFKARI